MKDIVLALYSCHRMLAYLLRRMAASSFRAAASRRNWEVMAATALQCSAAPCAVAFEASTLSSASREACVQHIDYESRVNESRTSRSCIHVPSAQASASSANPKAPAEAGSGRWRNTDLSISSSLLSICKGRTLSDLKRISLLNSCSSDAKNLRFMPSHNCIKRSCRGCSLRLGSCGSLIYCMCCR